LFGKKKEVAIIAQGTPPAKAEEKPVKLQKVDEAKPIIPMNKPISKEAAKKVQDELDAAAIAEAKAIRQEKETRLKKAQAEWQEAKEREEAAKVRTHREDYTTTWS
jgi:hypothetical protein